MGQRDLWVSPLCWTPWNAFLNKLAFWSCRDCHFVKEGNMRALERPPFPPWPSEPCDSFDAVSPLLYSWLFVRGLCSPPGCLQYRAHSSWHILLVLSQIRRSKITASVVSHSFRSMGLLSKITLLDCSAWGIIDQYQVCSLFCIWLLNVTHSVLISYAVLVHISGPRVNILNCQRLAVEEWMVCSLLIWAILTNIWSFWIK